MSQQRASIPLPFSKIVPVKPVNDEFTLTKVYVCSPGKNRNMSYLRREELDNAKDTLAYVPVVGHLMEVYDENGNVTGHRFGGHDYVITDDLQMKALTVPFGVVTADEPEYETVIEFGKEKEYQTAYAILWTGRYPELKDAIYSDETWFGQSMEMNFDNYEILEEDSNYVELHGLSYSALCILGKSDDPSQHVEPCFPSARFDPVQFDLGNDSFSKAMAEMRMQLSLCFDMNTSKKGGEMDLNQEKIDEIFASAEITQDEIDFEITEDMTEDQLLAAIEDFKKRKCGEVEENACKPKKKYSLEDHNDEPSLFSATVNQKREALRNALDPIIVRDTDGNIQSELEYWVEDFDDTYVFVERYYWTQSTYECKYGRFPYTFDEASKTASITGEFEEMIKMWLTKEEAAKVEADRVELDTLRKFKANAEDAKFQQDVDELCAQFEDLCTLEEFASIKERAREFASLDEMETQLYALRGKQVKASKKQAPAAFSVKVGIDRTDDHNEDPYGGIFSKYNIRPKQ